MSKRPITAAGMALAALAACTEASPPAAQPVGDSAAVNTAITANASAPATPVAADAGAVANALRAAGYVAWDEIERESGGRQWEIEGARRADGSEWDLKLDARTFAVIEREREGAPIANERDRIAAALRAAGYSSWGTIEADEDGRRWEIDDARRADGSRWEVELNADTLAIVKVDREN